MNLQLLLVKTFQLKLEIFVLVMGTTPFKKALPPSVFPLRGSYPSELLKFQNFPPFSMT